MLGADLGAVVALDAIKAEEAAGYAAGKTAGGSQIQMK